VTHTWRKRLLIGVVYVLLDVTIGLAVGTLAWLLIEVLSGNNFGWDIGGNDGLDRLLICLDIAGFCGFAVGLVHALARQS